MKLEISDLWSTDLDHPVDGSPPDMRDFSIGVHVSIAEVGKPGVEVFCFVVESPSQIALRNHREFVSHTLVIEEFSWSTIRDRITDLLRHCESSPDWEAVIFELRPYLLFEE